MKTWTAFLSHLGIAALQAIVAAPAINQIGSQLPPSTNPLANVGIQLAIQAGLAALQGIVANINSNSDPNGNKLTESVNGGFTTKTN